MMEARIAAVAPARLVEHNDNNCDSIRNDRVELSSNTDNGKVIDDLEDEQQHQQQQQKKKKRKQPTEDPTMELTEQEKQWSIQTREAFLEEEEICSKVFSDFEIVCFAIVDQGDIDRSMERAICLQAFRMTHNINDTPQEGIDIFTRQQELCPGMLLSIERCPNEDQRGSHVAVLDLGKYYPLRFMDGNPRDFRCCIGSIYYQIICTQPDFQSVRDGFRQVFEMDGMGWQNLSFKAEMKNVDELLSSLPYRRKQIKCLRMPSVALVVLSLLRPFMPKEEYNAFCFGTEELQREFPEPISNFYLQPTPQAAFDQSMKRVRELLTRRYENQQTFRLSD